jgi:hypothetical protein
MIHSNFMQEHNLLSLNRALAEDGSGPRQLERLRRLFIDHNRVDRGKRRWEPFPADDEGLMLKSRSLIVQAPSHLGVKNDESRYNLSRFRFYNNFIFNNSYSFYLILVFAWSLN